MTLYNTSQKRLTHSCLTKGRKSYHSKLPKASGIHKFDVNWVIQTMSLLYTKKNRYISIHPTSALL